MAKFDLLFSVPLMNAAGTLGFTPDISGPVDIGRLGAFVTDPVSLEPRRPAGSRAVLPFAGGFLLHSGYPNPGLEAVIRRYAESWRRSPVPVLVHLLLPGDDYRALYRLREMAGRLEQVDGVMGLEVSLPLRADIDSAAAAVQALQGELPLILRIPLDHTALFSLQVERLEGLELAAVSLGSPRGALVGPAGELVHGRLMGPALFPQALQAVRLLAAAGLPVIGAGGVYRRQQIEQMLDAGALAVQLDAVLWRSGIPIEDPVQNDEISSQ